MWLVGSPGVAYATLGSAGTAGLEVTHKWKLKRRR